MFNFFAKTVSFTEEEKALLKEQGFLLNQDATQADYPCPVIPELRNDTHIEQRKWIEKKDKYYHCQSYFYCAIMYGLAYPEQEREDSRSKKVKTLKEALDFFSK